MTAHNRPWRFPEPDAPWLLRGYIGGTVIQVDERPEHWLALTFDSGRIEIPLDLDSRVGIEAAHLVGVDDRGRVDPANMWIW